MAPSSVSNFSAIGSTLDSARELLRAEQMRDKEAAAKAIQKAKDLEAQCKDLRKQLKAAKKRPRAAAVPPGGDSDPPPVENPKKRPSPEPKDKPVGHLVDIMAGTGTAGNPASDDEVEVSSSLVDIFTVPQPTKWINGKLLHWDRFFGYASGCH